MTELILRGIFLPRKVEIDWFYQRGASALWSCLELSQYLKGNKFDLIGIECVAIQTAVAGS